MSDEVEYLAEEISKQKSEGVAWVLLIVYSEMQKERDGWKELLSKKGERLEDQ